MVDLLFVVILKNFIIIILAVSVRVCLDRIKLRQVVEQGSSLNLIVPGLYSLLLIVLSF